MTKALLELHGLKKSFGGLKVTNGVSFSLETGARVALIGPNGAGKTTLVDLICGALKPDAGRILLDGKDVTRLSPAARVRAGLSRSFQLSRLFAEETPLDHLALAILQREGAAKRPFGNVRAMPAIMQEAGKRLAALGLDKVAERPAGTIAYGQQRLLELALALALRPRVLLLDEPGAGVPQGEMALIDAALAGLPDDLAVLMIDHDMDLVFRFADRVVVIDSGSIIFDGTPEAAGADEAVRAAYLGRIADGRRRA